MNVPETPVTFSFVGYSHLFPNHIVYSFKLQIIPEWTIILSPYSSDGGESYCYHVKDENGIPLDVENVIVPSSPTRFHIGLPEVRIRLSSEHEWIPLKEDYIQQMNDIYNKTRSH